MHRPQLKGKKIKRNTKTLLLVRGISLLMFLLRVIEKKEKNTDISCVGLSLSDPLPHGNNRFSRKNAHLLLLVHSSRILAQLLGAAVYRPCL